MMWYKRTRAVFRLLSFLFIVILYMLNALWIGLFMRHPVVRRRKLTGNSRFYSRLILRAFNIELICPQNIPEDEVSLLVGNHIGFIDIVCLQALRSCVFITSLEMKNTPGLGQITDLAGCAYVDRKNRMNIQHELRTVADVLSQNLRVVLYAESVASNGEQVLPFKKTLLMSAGLAEKPIRPFVFNFRQVNRGPVGFEHRDSLCWYGDQNFVGAIWRSMLLDSVTCEIEFLPLVYPSALMDRSELARELHQTVSARYIPFRREVRMSGDQHEGRIHS